MHNDRCIEEITYTFSEKSKKSTSKINKETTKKSRNKSKISRKSVKNKQENHKNHEVLIKWREMKSFKSARLMVSSFLFLTTTR